MSNNVISFLLSMRAHLDECESEEGKGHHRFCCSDNGSVTE